MGDRFDLVGVCDLDGRRRTDLAGELGVARAYAAAEAMLAAERPDVMVFATPPAARLGLVEQGVRHGVRAIACEKPLALSLGEARQIVALCAGAGVRGVVCHQLRHAAHWRRVKEIVDTGAIGPVRFVHATGRPSMLRVGTHLVDAMLWLGGGGPATWVLGQAHGHRAYGEDHPGPEHLAGVVALASGVRGFLEVGSLAPCHLAADQFWGDVSLTVEGAHGHARVVLGRGWEAFGPRSGGRMESGPADPAPQEARHLELLADWLDDPAAEHPASFAAAYHGLEILLGLALSSADRRQVTLPIGPEAGDILGRLGSLLAGPGAGG